MSVFQVTDSANFVSGPFSQPYLVRNAGTEIVYLGQDSSLQVGSQSISMPGGSTLNWSGETQLWAVTEPGKVSQLELLYTGNSAFTPGPSTVSIAIDVSEIIDTLINAGLSYTSARYDCSQFGSLHLELVTQLGALGVYDGTKDFILSIQWCGQPSGGFPFSEVMGFAGAGETYITTPVKAPYFEISILRVDGSDVGPNMQVIVKGVQNNLNSYQCIPDPNAYNLTAFAAILFNDIVQQKSGMTAVSYTMGVPLLASCPIPHSAGPASVGFSRLLQTGAGGTTLQVLTAAVGALSGIVWYQNLAAAGTLLERGVNLVLPRWPISISPSRSAVGVTNAGILEISTDPSQ